MNKKKPKAIIIGAGIGGMAIANLLAKAGYDVAIYEKEKTAGGRAGQIMQDGFIFDSGPSWYLMPEVFEHYYKLLDTKISSHYNLLKLSPAYKVFFQHERPMTITSEIALDMKTFEKIENGAGLRLEQYVKQGQKIYEMSLRHFLYTNFLRFSDLAKPEIIKNAFRLFWLSFRPLHKHVASYVSDQRLQQILEYPSVFLGTSPFDAPALYSLMSALDFKDGVYYPEGGMYKIIQSLLDIGNGLGVKYHFDSEVIKVQTKNGTATGIKLADESTITADIVISNSDMWHTENNLLDEQDRSYPAKYWKKQKAGPSALLIYLGIDGELSSLEHHNLLFVDNWRKNFEDIYENKKLPDDSSLYISKTSHTDKSVSPEGTENIFILVPLPPSISLAKSEEENMCDKILKQIDSMCGVDLSSRILTKQIFGPNDFKTKYYSYQSSMLGPSHTLFQSAMFRPTNKSKKLSNFYYVGGGTQPGVGLPMCLISAEQAYKRIMGIKNPGAVSSFKYLESEKS